MFGLASEGNTQVVEASVVSFCDESITQLGEQLGEQETIYLSIYVSIINLSLYLSIPKFVPQNTYTRNYPLGRKYASLVELTDNW